MTTSTEGQETAERRLTLVEQVFAQREFGVIVAVVGLLVVGSFVRADVFWTLGNFAGVLRNAAVVTTIGYGMTLLITAGEFDLSVGSVMAISAGLTAIMLLDGYSIWLVFATVLVLAALFGIVQGILVTKLGLPSLIVTIGTLTLLRGGHLALLGSVTQTLPSERTPIELVATGGTLQLPFSVLLPFTDIGLFTIPAINYTVPLIHSTQQTFTSVPLQIFWLVALGGIFHYVLFYTRFGYRVKATGGEIKAAEYTGIKTDHVKIAGFAIVAVMAAFAGVGQLAFTGNVSPLTGDGTELIVIAAVVIGGTNLFGGEGTIVGTVLGALVFTFTQNILVLAGFGTQLFAIFTGLFIILAVGVDAITRRARYEAILTEYIEPLQELLQTPSTYYEAVEGRIQGTGEPLSFLSIVTLTWMVPTLLVAILTFVPSAESPLIPGGFSLFIVNGDVAAFGTMPLFGFVLMGVTSLLTIVFLHVCASALGGTGGIDETIQVVGYGFAPAVFLFLPMSLQGLQFIPVVVGVTLAPIVLAVLALLVIGTRVLHDLDLQRGVGAVAGTLLLWLLAWLFVSGQTPPA